MNPESAQFEIGFDGRASHVPSSISRSTWRKRNKRDREGARRITEQMSYENELYAMQAMTRRRSAMLGVMGLGFDGTWMANPCGQSGLSGSESECPAPDLTPPDTPAEYPAPMEDPCIRHRTQLVGNPSTDVALRNKHIAAFGTACYASEADTFDCFYEKWEVACADAVKIGEVSGNAPYDKGYTCQPVGNGDYTLQVGPDVGNKLTLTDPTRLHTG